jgi:nucleotide-binding universal stress UspA family protein
VSVASAPRRVFVLGRKGTFDVGAEARRAAADGAELVLLSVGYPVTESQSSAVEEGARLAVDLRLPFDAVLVTDRAHLAEHVGPAQQVVVVASGRERRTLERLLGPDTSPKKTIVSPRRDRGRTDARPDPQSDESMGTKKASPPVPERSASDNALVPHGDVQAAGSTGSESVEALTGREVLQPLIETVWTREDAQARKRARFIVYLGAAPGVGKTFSMLHEGRRRKERGTDVVVGIVQTYGRPRTLELLEGLEVIPPRTLTYRGAEFEEMDIEALIERRPEVALVDELAHTNIPGSRRAKRWEDVLDLLEEGIIVITTLNVQHLASLNDVVAEVTGVKQQETVPDWVLDLADQVELVDMSPYALRRRMLHGNVYPDPRKAELALQRYFTEENLTALRELALMRVANQVDEQLLRGWSKGGIPETRERILVCISRPELSEELIRRGARIAQRTRGDLLVVHAAPGERSTGDTGWLDKVRILVHELGGSLEVLSTEDPVDTVLSLAYQQHVTLIVVGESGRSPWQEVFRGSFVDRLIKRASNIDVLVSARKER